MLRQKGVVGRFVEFYGPGLHTLTLADRATIGNMAPEYGATCGFFPVDAKTIVYMRFTGRSDDQIALVQAYCKAQGMWHDENAADPIRSAERRVGNECVRTCRSRWSPDNIKKK